jgi:hypothetical protein
MPHMYCFRVSLLACVFFTVVTTARGAEKWMLEPVLRITSSNGQDRLATWSAMSGDTSRKAETAFVAVVSSSWPTGLVPVFAIENESRFELRRLPARGTEGGADPLFFALPREDEPHATGVAGAWSGAATNAQGAKYFPEWELAVDDERIAGRFSPSGEYRVAYITGGTFRSNRLELYAEYVQDRYTLSGDLRNGELTGTWRQHDDSERGTWSAAREGQGTVPDTTNAVPLYEWRRGGERHYAIAPPRGGEWQRADKPLCRVWKQ